MSCEDCDKATDLVAFNQPTAFFRWKNGNVAIVGCEKHVKEIIDFLRYSKKLKELLE